MQTETLIRYSDKDLAEFKQVIEKKLEEARKELSYLQGLISRKDENGTEDSAGGYEGLEDGTNALDNDNLGKMASRQADFITKLTWALGRIENKTYGICRATGKLIDKQRLLAVPHTTQSIEAKKLQNN